MGVVANTIQRKLSEALSPSRLEVTDDSARHSGHAGAGAAGESHFNLIVESAAFTGLGAVARQRLVMKILADELGGPVHALSIKANAPGES